VIEWRWPAKKSGFLPQAKRSTQGLPSLHVPVFASPEPCAELIVARKVAISDEPLTSDLDPTVFERRGVETW
jgi:hypothetical protein